MFDAHLPSPLSIYSIYLSYSNDQLYVCPLVFGDIRPASAAAICNATNLEYMRLNARLPPMNQKFGWPLGRQI